MVLTYLLDSKQRLLEEKIDLDREYEKIQSLIQENKVLSCFIEKSENNSYKSFVPSNYKNDLNSKYIQELEEKRIALEEKNTYYEHQIKIIEERIEELNYIINLVKQEREYTKKLEEALSNSEKK